MYWYLFFFFFFCLWCVFVIYYECLHPCIVLDNLKRGKKILKEKGLFSLFHATTTLTNYKGYKQKQKYLQHYYQCVLKSQSEPTVSHFYFSVFLMFTIVHNFFFQTFNQNLDVSFRVLSEQRRSQCL